MTFSALRIEAIRLAVNLGCTAAERSSRQEVRVAVELRFAEAPLAMLTDNLADTICYAEVAQAIQQHCEAREYQLIEKMAHEIFGIVKEIVRPNSKVEITLHKMQPPIDCILGGTVFRCGDFS